LKSKEKSPFPDHAPATNHGPSVLKGFLAAAIVVGFWSGFNIVSRLGGRSVLTPYDLAAIRFGISGIVLTPIFLFGRRSLTPLQTLVLGTLGGLCYGLFIYSGFALAPASHAGTLVNGGIPFSTMLISWLVLGHRPGRRALASLLVVGLGIVAIGMQSLGQLDGVPKHQWLGDGLFICAAICFAAFGLLLKRWRAAPLETVAGVAFVSMILYTPVYLLFLPKAIAVAPMSLIGLQCVYQGLIAASLASLLYAYANQTIGPAKASLMLALVPGLSALLAVPLLGEPLSPMTIVGVLLVTVGAILGTANQASK
jgi:drug/metabolite transporter (DMT)-like permease